MRTPGLTVLMVVSLAAGACGSSGGGSCSTSTLTCGMVLPATQLLSLQPTATGYTESAMVGGTQGCNWSLPSSSSGIFQVFCGNATLFDTQVTTAMTAFPTANIFATDTIGKKSTEITVGPPTQSGSFAEIVVLTTNGKYVFDVSLQNAASDIAQVRPLAMAIDAQLSTK